MRSKLKKSATLSPVFFVFLVALNHNGAGWWILILEFLQTIENACEKKIMLPGFSFTFCCEMKNLECEVGVVFRFRYKVALSVIN